MKRVIVMATVGTLAGCSVVSVSQKEASDGNSTKVDGIPFYVKVEKFKKTTTYTETWLRATLTVQVKAIDTKDNKESIVDAGKQPYIVDIPKGPNTALAEIKTKILDSDTASAGAAKEVIDAFVKLELYDHKTAVPEAVANVVTSEWVVDRNKTYYLNAPLPWFGAASLTQKLASDGTLTEMTSAPDTKLAEGLATLIPFKEFLSGKFVETVADATKTAATPDDKMALTKALKGIDLSSPPKPAMEKEKDRRVVYAMTLAVDEVGYEYVLTSLPQDQPVTDLSALKFADVAADKALFTRKPLGGAKEEEKKDEGQKIGIAGSINFPRQWGDVPKEKE